jgi:peptidyl-Lys metalloendopeptidase
MNGNSTSHSTRVKSLGRLLVAAIAATAALGCSARGPARLAAEEPACAGADLTAAGDARVEAGRALLAAIAAVDHPSSSDAERLTKWFGIRTSGGGAAVRATLERARAFGPGATFRCAVNTNAQLGDVFAYVRPDQSFVVVLGAFFFRAPATGYDSRPGVIVHEMTHFVLAGATQDHVYGRAGALQLAATNPGEAQRNADNYEYFVEATAYDLN